MRLLCYSGAVSPKWVAEQPPRWSFFTLVVTRFMCPYFDLLWLLFTFGVYLQDFSPFPLCASASCGKPMTCAPPPNLQRKRLFVCSYCLIIGVQCYWYWTLHGKYSHMSHFRQLHVYAKLSIFKFYLNLTVGYNFYTFEIWTKMNKK